MRRLPVPAPVPPGRPARDPGGPEKARLGDGFGDVRLRVARHYCAELARVDAQWSRGECASAKAQLDSLWRQIENQFGWLAERGARDPASKQLAGGFARAGRRVLRSQLGARERRSWFELLASVAADADEERPDLRAEALCELSVCWRELGDATRSLECAREALGAVREPGPLRADVLYALGRAQQYAGRNAEAVGVLGECLQLRRSQRGSHHPDVLETLSALAYSWDDLGDPAAIVRTLAPVLEGSGARALAESPELAQCYRMLALGLCQQGELEPAERYGARALELDRRLLSMRHPVVAIDLNDLSFVYLQRGNRSRALECMQEALEIERDAFGEHHPAVGLRLLNLGAIWREMGESSRAAAALERALTIYERTGGSRHPHLPGLLGHLGRAYLDEGQRDRAIAALTRAIALWRELAPHGASSLESDLRLLHAAQAES